MGYAKIHLTRAPTLTASAFARFTSPADFPLLACRGYRQRRINFRAFNEAIEAGLNGLDMYKDVAATVVTRDEAKPSIWVEPLHSPVWHGRSPLENNCL